MKVRFGTWAHLLFTFYAFLCILVVCGSLLRESFNLGLFDRLTFSLCSGRCGYGECSYGHEHHRSMFPPSNRNCRLCGLRRSACDLHLRLGAHHHSVYCDLLVPWKHLVSSVRSDLLPCARVLRSRFTLPFSAVGHRLKSGVYRACMTYFYRLRRKRRWSETKEEAISP